MVVVAIVAVLGSINDTLYHPRILCMYVEGDGTVYPCTLSLHPVRPTDHFMKV